ncbi:MAG: hypothetical protein MOIL_00355 [Candidatus Methanolliviera sp. GoM_oil]|nr:MAG: hypothetical protein MOIL_00355 [Candidatus Methanolliviera sp. GoM_oil]
MKKRERPQREVIPTPASQAVKLVAVGTEFGMSVVIMALIGYLSFKEFFGEDFAALGITVGIFIGFFTGVYMLYREFCKKLLK